MKSQSEIGLKPADVLEVDVDTSMKHIEVKCEKHPEKCIKHGIKFGDKLKWKSKKGNPFSIQFEKDKTPFLYDFLTYEQAISDNEAIHDGSFKYTVIDDSDPRNILDPEIVVDPPKGGDE